MQMIERPRRLRSTPGLRKMVRETRVDASSLIYPMFVTDGSGRIEEIKALPGQNRYTVDMTDGRIESLLKAGVSSIMLFGIPEHKDELGTQAYAEDGIIQRAVSHIKEHYPEIMVAPSDMMDGRVKAIREALDAEGFSNTPLMSYAVKYASSFYGPFREAAGSAPAFGDRKSYQMDYHNRREGIKEALLDVAEGADIIMVKPAMPYLDMIREVRDTVNVPVAAYSVSGEYAMVKAAAANGWIDEDSIICEMAVGAFRAGAQMYETYFAEELAGFIKEGRIG